MVSTTLTTTVSQQTAASGSNQTVHQLRPHSSLHYSTTLQSSAIRGNYYLNSNSNSDSVYNGSSAGSDSKDTSGLYNGHFTNTVRTQLSSSNVIPIPTTTSTVCPRPDLLLNSPTSSCTGSNVLRNELNLLESTSPPLSDQISILFPKCRPKSDANTNPATSTIQNSSNNFAQSPPAASGSSYSSESVSSARISTNPFLCLPSPSGTETKRSKFENNTSPKEQEVLDMPRKSSGYNQPAHQQPYQQQHYHTQQQQHQQQQHQQQQQQQQQQSSQSTHRTMKSSGNQNPFINYNYWDTRHNTTPAGTVLNSPELTSENTSRRHGHNYLQKPQHIRLGRSPVSHQNPTHDYYNVEANDRELDVQNRGDNENYNRGTLAAAAASSVVAASNGGSNSGVVVFDDIADSWQSLRVTTGSPPATTVAPLVESNVDGANLDMSKSENEAYKNYKKYLDKNFAINIEMRNGIIEYEGSPRRFGQGIPEDEEVQSQNYKFNAITSSPQKMHPIRPGFPQRILSTPQDSPPPLLNLKMSPVNNTEDTSNDVSEIGTLSDMTVSEVISEAVMAAPLTTGLCSSGTTIQEDTLVSTTTTAAAATAKSSTFDYLYEFSETRKVLEEFFECPSTDEKPIENGSDVDSIDIQYEFHSNVNREEEDEIILPPQLDHIFSVQPDHMNNSPTMDENYRPVDDDDVEGDDDDDDSESPQPAPVVVANISPVKPQLSQNHVAKQQNNFYKTNGSGSGGGVLDNRRTLTKDNDKLVQYRRDIDFFLESASRSSGDQMDSQDGINHNPVQPRSYRCSPETTDYDSNCGDLDSLSGEFNGVSTYCNYPKCYATSMPVLEDGLSSGHTSDTENNNRPVLMPGISMLMDVKRIQDNSNHVKSNRASPNVDAFTTINESPLNGQLDDSGRDSVRSKRDQEILGQSPSSSNSKVFQNIDPDLDSLYSISVFHRGTDMNHVTPPPPAPAPHRKPTVVSSDVFEKNQMDFIEQRPTSLTGGGGGGGSSNMVNHTKPLKPLEKPYVCNPPPSIPERLSNASPSSSSPVWVPRYLDTSAGKCLLDSSDRQGKNLSGDEEDVDTDLETDRLLGHQRLDDQGFYDDTKSSSWDRKPRSLLATSLSKFSPKVQQQNSKNSNGTLSLRQGFNSLLTSTPEIPPPIPPKSSTTSLLHNVGGGSMSSLDHSDKSPEKISPEVREECAVVTIGSPSADSGSDGSGNGSQKKDSQNAVTGEKKVKKSKSKEGGAVLIEGVLFRARYLGSTQLVCEGQPTKSTRMMQAEEAVSRIKAPDGDVQPSTEVDLFISTEKIMVLNTDLKEIMMDHALRTISYIADIGDLVVLMARRRFVSQDIDDGPKLNRTPKMICHVFESDEAQFIAQSIGQAFQVAYMEFLKANGIEDHSFVKEMDYQEVLNSQEIFGDELEIFAKKELQKEVVVPKAKGEILGVVIVESGWGSMLPTVVIANLMSSGAAARCGQLNIGDQLIAINGLSLVGLPLSTCQTYIKNTKNQTVVKFTVVPCAPVVEVKIKRPNTKYQLGFSVQNGVICSLLRGGIAERGGVRVGHRIIEINNQSVVAVPHEKIVNLLATSVGEILMKTMPTSMFRLLTGQENPIFI